MVFIIIDVDDRNILYGYILCNSHETENVDANLTIIHVKWPIVK